MANVASVRFKIKTALSPAKLSFTFQVNSQDQNVQTLASVPSVPASLATWTTVTVTANSVFKTGAVRNHVTHGLVFYWGASTADTSTVTGSQFQIGDIEFLDSSGAAVPFYTAVTPAGVPSTVSAVPALTATAYSLLNSSGTNTNRVVSDWNPNWLQTSSIADATVAGRAVKILYLRDYQGINISDGSAAFPVVNANLKTNLHLSYWTATGHYLNVQVVGSAGANTIWTTPSPSSLVLNSWQDIDFTIGSGFAGLTTINQLKFTCESVHDNSTYSPALFYLDNLYFH